MGWLVNDTFFIIKQWCKQDQDQDQSNKTKTAAYKSKTKTTGSKQRHLAGLTFKQVNATVNLHSSDVLSTK